MKFICLFPHKPLKRVRRIPHQKGAGRGMNLRISKKSSTFATKNALFVQSNHKKI